MFLETGYVYHIKDKYFEFATALIKRVEEL